LAPAVSSLAGRHRPSLKTTTGDISLESLRRVTRPLSARTLRHDPISHYGFPVG